MNDYSRYYAVLGVTHGVEWKALRARYRRLIGQWHPDRFLGEAPERALAEERSKQITIAYQALERYYRDHGVLPPEKPATFSAETGAAPSNAGAAPEGAARPAKPAETTAAEPRPGRRPARHRALIALSALVVGVYGAYRYSDGGIEEPSTIAAPQLPQVAAPEPQPPESQRETGVISAGSTLGDVYAIQGIPTSTEGDIWHYGKSSIRFANGKVASWTQHPDSPLRIARDQPVELREGTFDVGSTKEEVRSIQGSPVTETETVWDYGLSRVYFERNRVVRWEMNLLQPLHVAR